MSKGLESIKKILKRGFAVAGIDLTKNMVYDRLTRQVMDRVLTAESNCIDIGSHDGDMLYRMVQLSPKGRHFAFEPIPAFYAALKRHFGKPVTVLPYALSDKREQTTFRYVANAPAYSGLKERKYATSNPDVRTMQIETRTLDETIPDSIPIHFVKIDVEGAEFSVLNGGKKTISRWKPVVVFEFGIGASDYYDVAPEMMYGLIVEELGMQVSTLEGFLMHKPPLSRDRFAGHYANKTEYYFVAHP